MGLWQLCAGPFVDPVGKKGADHGDQKRPDQIANSPPEYSIKDHKNANGPYDAAEYRCQKKDQEGYGASGDVHDWMLAARSGPSEGCLLYGEEDLGAPLGGVGLCAGVGEVDLPGSTGRLKALGPDPFE